MKAFLPLVLVLAGCAASPDRPRTYLVSVVGLPLETDDSLEAFSFSTWGVTFNAVCHVPPGWTIKAGGSATPQGGLAGEGSLGTTWFRQGNPPELRSLALATLYGPVQPDAMRDADGAGVVPATFTGSATVATLDGERTRPLTDRNVRLVPARRCPRG